jgi:NAD(P)-dependent dehydrogenase (short-subunit alcohol dehydrogenase family)
MGKSVLISGANRGIGQQLARMLATTGWDVLVGARDLAKGNATAARLRKETGGRLKAVELDVTSDASVATAAQKLRDGAVRIDALVNNAGVYGVARGPDGVALTLETNFFGPLRVTLGILPLLRDGATITNVTSGLGALSNLDAEHRRALSDRTLTRDALVEMVRAFVRTGGASWGTDAYGVSKAALDHLGRIWAAELEGTGVRFLTIDPGEMDTAMHAAAIPGADPSTLRRPADVAGAILARIRGVDDIPSGARIEAVL